jgi:hypothetical protein
MMNFTFFSMIFILSYLQDGFMIGELPPYSDVVYNGTALPLWLPTTSNKLGEYIYHQTFFLSLVNVNDSQLILKPLVWSNF